jgi:hypothetical protein
MGACRHCGACSQLARALALPAGRLSCNLDRRAGICAWARAVRLGHRDHHTRFFDESRVIANPVQPDPADPTRLVPYSGPPLTVGGELNKLAVNFGFGRNWAGIHWRSDASASMALGEEVAIGMLRDERTTLREPFDGFSFTRFDGSRVTI